MHVAVKLMGGFDSRVFIAKVARESNPGKLSEEIAQVEGCKD